jgi:hypothetical protein
VTVVTAEDVVEVAVGTIPLAICWVLPQLWSLRGRARRTSGNFKGTFGLQGQSAHASLPSLSRDPHWALQTLTPYLAGSTVLYSQ